MKATSLVDPDALKRDWVDGTVGGVFWGSVQGYCERIRAIGADAVTRGVLIAESEPQLFAAAFFAALQTGASMILANPKWRRLEWEQVRQQAHPAIIFGDVPLFGSEGKSTQKLQPGAILIPTGGSSGVVKFTIHNWGTLVAACRGFQSFIGSGPVHSCCMLPLYHVSGLMQLVRSFLSGGQVAFSDFKTLEAVGLPSFSTDLTCLSLVPTQLQRMLGQETVVNWLKKLRAIFLGGAPMATPLRESVRELKLPIVPTYGMTETAAMVTALPSNEFIAGNESAGRPLKHAEVYVVREDGSTCSTDEPGRIRIRASSMCLGYHGGVNTDFSKTGFLTNDEGFLDSRGQLHIIGRGDRIIISGGEKIEPHEIEQAMIETGITQEVLAVGWPDVEWGQRLVAFYVPTDNSKNVEDWETQLRANLVNYKIPRQIIPVAKLPLNAQGKPDRILMEQLVGNSDYS